MSLNSLTQQQEQRKHNEERTRIWADRISLLALILILINHVCFFSINNLL